MYTEQTQQQSLIIKSIAHSFHFSILNPLNKRELTAKGIATIAKFSKATLLRHLSTLSTNRLIKVLYNLYCSVQSVQQSTIFTQQKECLSQHS